MGIKKSCKDCWYYDKEISPKMYDIGYICDKLNSEKCHHYTYCHRKRVMAVSISSTSMIIVTVSSPGFEEANR